MGTFAQDNFTAAANTDLSGQTDALGNTWSTYIIGSQIRENGSNAVFENNSANAVLSNSGTPPSADYTVQCNTTAGSAGGSESAGPMARVSSASGGNGYLALINQGSAAAQLFKLVAGSFTQLGSNVALGSATQTAVQCQVTGSTIKFNINGANQITQTDSSITAAGLSGILLNGTGSTSTLLSSFSAFAGTTWGFEQYTPFSISRFAKGSRVGSVMAGDSTQLTPLINPFKEGWAVQPWQPPHRAPEIKFGSIARGDDGTQATLINPFKEGWAVQPWQPPHRAPEIKFGALARGDDGTQATLINPFKEGWAVQPWQPPHRAPEVKFGALARGDDGTQTTLITPFPEGWAIQPWQPPYAVRSIKAAGIMRGDDGTEAVFVFVPAGGPPAWGFEFRDVPIFLRRRVPNSGDDGTQATLIIPFKEAWAVQPWQPPHPRPEKGGILADGDRGIQFILLPAPPTPVSREDLQRPFFSRAGAIMAGDINIAAVFIPPPPAVTTWGYTDQQLQFRKRVVTSDIPTLDIPQLQFLPYGWDATIALTVHPRPERAAALMPLSLVEAQLFGFQPYGWEFQVQQPPHPRPERGGAFMPLSMVEAQLFGFQPFGWEFQIQQPPHPRPERTASILPLSMVEAQLFGFQPYGWEIQAPVSWRRKWELYPLIGDDGIESPFVVVPPIVLPNTAWPSSDVHYRRPIYGAILVIGDGGIQAAFIPTVVTNTQVMSRYGRSRNQGQPLGFE